MKKYLILLVAGFIAIPALAGATSTPETVSIPADVVISPVVTETDGQSTDVSTNPADDKKDTLTEDGKSDELISPETETITTNENDNIIKKKRDEFRLKQKNERENMRLELKKDKKAPTATMSAPVQKSTFEKIKGFFKSFF